MKILINERLSKHRCKTPEGYLICTDAILARTGKQTYRKNEIFKDSDDETEIEVDRTEDEVFAPQTLASFENKPVTVEHPDEDVNVHNYKEYAVGFVRDVHRGEVDGQPVILGNLVITDEQTIQEIENGEHTDLSCGYDCDIADEPNPCQRNIRGNHVALCEQGRAGIARIVDSKCKDFDDTGKNIRVVKEFIEQNGNKFDKRKDADAILEYIKKRTGIANADYGDVLYIIKEYTRAEITDSVKDAASIVKGIIYSTNHEIAEGTFGNEIVEKIDKNIYVTYWTDGTTHSSHTSSDMIDPAFWATSYNGAELDMYDFNRLGKYINAKSRLVKIAKEYLNDSAKDQPSVFTKGFRERDARMKVANLTNGYAIVPTSKWRKFGLNAEAERFATNLDEARYIRSSLERNDGISFVIIDVTQRRTTDSMKDTREIKPWALRKGQTIVTEDGNATVLSVKGNNRDGYDVEVKLLPSGKDTWYFMPNESITVLDSKAKDALIPPTKESINKFESLLRILNIKIDKKGLTTFGRVHYQVRAIEPFDQFVKTLDRIDYEMDKLGIPTTYSANTDGKVCTAGIDLGKQYVKDSQKVQKIQKIIKAVKSIK